MEVLLSIGLGIGLSAACGFRVFIPLLVASIASLSGYLNLSHGFEWIGTYPALIVFVTASVLEVAAYYIPWVDNIMDSMATPAAVIAGTVAAASVFVDMGPMLRWTLALIAGGGTAAVFQGSTSLLRGASSMFTGGFGNIALATAELGLALLLSLLAIALPLLCGVAVLIGIFFILKKLLR